jgi:hypothetical protein
MESDTTIDTDTIFLLIPDIDTDYRLDNDIKLPSGIIDIGAARRCCVAARGAAPGAGAARMPARRFRGAGRRALAALMRGAGVRRRWQALARGRRGRRCGVCAKAYAGGGAGAWRVYSAAYAGHGKCGVCGVRAQALQIPNTDTDIDVLHYRYKFITDDTALRYRHTGHVQIPST